MLILSRKVNEVIRIADNITIMVVEIKDNKVRLGIVADPSVPVHRQEVWDAIHKDDPPPDLRSDKEKWEDDSVSSR